MTVQSQQVNCGDCGELLDETTSIDPTDRLPCPKCGSIKRAIHITIAETIQVKEMLGIKGKRPGQKKPFMEQKTGDDLHRKTGKWNKIHRLIDRDKDSYEETITDPETGEIIHQQKESLSKHYGHGGAKKKNKSL